MDVTGWMAATLAASSIAPVGMAHPGVGWLGATVAALFWGSYLVPVKRLPTVDPLAAQLSMAIGIVLLAIPLAIASGAWIPNGWGLLAGVIWALGNYGSIFVVRALGLARGLALWATIGIGVSFLWGALFFREPVLLPVAVGGVALLVAGIALMNWPDRPDGTQPPGPRSTNSPVNRSSQQPSRRPKIQNQGWWLCGVVGLLFGSQSVPFAFAAQSPIAFVPSMSLGILGTASLLAGQRGGRVLRQLPRSSLLALVCSGMLWNVANVGSFFAVDRLGMAVGMPLTQFAIVVNAAWGLWLFREVTGRQRILRVAIGTFCAFGGIILIGGSRL
ncbi:GRP family sugar transporter [Limnothrix sp. PR1529]|uniref:GRP family sugar transporter n=1 Tax=Limnothrix sp. PR1529 TaxID=1704291 RepID=UPI0013047886|nr:GRP family sugar transporter [Limnothrix sp. PR1529]